MKIRLLTQAGDVVKEAVINAPLPPDKIVYLFREFLRESVGNVFSTDVFDYTELTVYFLPR